MNDDLIIVQVLCWILVSVACAVAVGLLITSIIMVMGI